MAGDTRLKMPLPESSDEALTLLPASPLTLEKSATVPAKVSFSPQAFMPSGRSRFWFWIALSFLISSTLSCSVRRVPLSLIALPIVRLSCSGVMTIGSLIGSSFHGGAG